MHIQSKVTKPEFKVVPSANDRFPSYDVDVAAAKAMQVMRVCVCMYVCVCVCVCVSVCPSPFPPFIPPPLCACLPAH